MATPTMEIASIIFFQPFTKIPQMPEKRAVAAIITQRMFLASCFTDAITDGSFGRALSFAPKILALLSRSLASPTIPVYMK